VIDLLSSRPHSPQKTFNFFREKLCGTALAQGAATVGEISPVRFDHRDSKLDHKDGREKAQSPLQDAPA
jgi:hypothetical protein